MSKRKKQEINQADLVKIQGRELKYNQLCKALNMPIKNGYAKTTQLADLEMYCQLERLSSPTRFAVKEVYDGDLLEALNGHNKYQALFEAALYQALINNHAEQLCLSNMEMLEMFEDTGMIKIKERNEDAFKIEFLQSVELSKALHTMKYAEFVELMNTINDYKNKFMTIDIV